MYCVPIVLGTYHFVLASGKHDSAAAESTRTKSRSVKLHPPSTGAAAARPPRAGNGVNKKQKRLSYAAIPRQVGRCGHAHCTMGRRSAAMPAAARKGWGSRDPSSVTYQGGLESVRTIRSERGDGIAARGLSVANADDSGWHYLQREETSQ